MPYAPVAPQLPSNRFSAAVRAHGAGIIPLHPFTDRPLDLATCKNLGLINGEVSLSDVDLFDRSRFNVGLLCGARAGVTALHVATRSAQTWLDECQIPSTPRFYDGHSRFYLFNHQGNRAERASLEIIDGLYLWSGGQFLTYPGSIFDGHRFVFWEEAPDRTPLANLPDWLLQRLN